MKTWGCLVLVLIIYNDGVQTSPIGNDFSGRNGERTLNLEHVYFRLYTRENPTNEELLYIDDLSALKASHFNGNRTTKVATHGFRNDGLSFDVLGPRDAFLQVEDCNFIGVDWSKCASNIYYPAVVECGKDLGHYVGQLLLFLEISAGLKPKDVHLMGHSVGAHAISTASLYFPEDKIARLTGLDPAGPLYENADPADKVDPSDAVIVDVIHTAINSLGTKQSLGTLDFYPNGGKNQPGCGSLDYNCNHEKAVEYFVESIYRQNREKYVGLECNNIDEATNNECKGEKGFMGLAAASSDPGIYHVDVIGKQP